MKLDQLAQQAMEAEEGMLEDRAAAEQAARDAEAAQREVEAEVWRERAVVEQAERHAAAARDAQQAAEAKVQEVRMVGEQLLQ